MQTHPQHQYPIPLHTHTHTHQGWDRQYLKKEEDNLARERIDRAGGGCGRGAGPSRDFWDFWYQKQLFKCILESNFLPLEFQNPRKSADPRRNLMPDTHTHTHTHAQKHSTQMTKLPCKHWRDLTKMLTHTICTSQLFQQECERGYVEKKDDQIIQTCLPMVERSNSDANTLWTSQMFYQ